MQADLLEEQICTFTTLLEIITGNFQIKLKVNVLPSLDKHTKKFEYPYVIATKYHIYNSQISYQVEDFVLLGVKFCIHLVFLACKQVNLGTFLLQLN